MLVKQVRNNYAILIQFNFILFFASAVNIIKVIEYIPYNVLKNFQNKTNPEPNPKWQEFIVSFTWPSG